ncbi:hypothetical protein [Bradyrhizobium vignae]|uniref:hypothetical protein n=1 Tax=Bradyrhizobium TaxID=374 RepID=UPI0013E898F1|nr:hypothetical protein [Bradyrhizobium vignae]
MKLLARGDDENVIRHRSGKILQSAAAACSHPSASDSIDIAHSVKRRLVARRNP